MTSFRNSVLALLLVLVQPLATAALKISTSVGYLASVRGLNGQSDFYDGVSYKARLAFAKKQSEFFLSYLYSNQVANYANVSSPNKSADHWASLGLRQYLAGNRRSFLEIGGLMARSNTLESGWGGSVGGGLNWEIGRFTIGTTTSYTAVFYEGFHRRCLTQTFDLGFIF
jgi:hypothetical protein